VLSDGEAAFDPLQIDVATVRFGPSSAGAVRSHVRDVNGDGMGDLLLRFKISAVGLRCRDTEATMTGRTYDGEVITATDSIRTVGCGRRP
jgi:hypothetical protein